MKIKKTLNFNDLAPDMEVQTAQGSRVRLSALWADGPLVLAFTRHFGCPQCKEMLDQLLEEWPQLAKAGLRIAVVTQAAPEVAREFCAQRAPEAICLADPERKLYAAYHLSKGTLRQTFLSWSVMRGNRRAANKKGYKPELPPAGQDAMLMSGIFIIGKDGRIRLPYYYDHIADHPEAELLLQGIFATNWNEPLEGPFGPAS